MSDFNLIDEPWIPCIGLRDGRSRECGVREVLVHAAEIREIADPSPLVTVAIHRVLLALLHRVFGPSNTDEWAAMWSRGQWDVERLDAYFRGWHVRFNLFDGRFPFYQAKSLDFSYAVPISKLTHELASGNNATLFDHTFDEAGLGLTAAVAARYLIAQQAFALSGTVSLARGEDSTRFKYADAAPLAKGAVTLVRGGNLFRTLMLNFHRYNIAEDVPCRSGSDDTPAWELNEETRAGDRRPRGYLDFLTWQSRRIRLQRDPDGIVRRVVIMKGYQFPDGYARRGTETMIGFRKNPKAKPGQDPWPPLGFQEERALWRDSLSLLQSVMDQRERPRIFDWLSDLVVEGVLDRSLIIPADFLGIRTDPTKAGSLLFWRHEHLAFPAQCLVDPRWLDQVRIALKLAESTGDEIRRRTLRLAAALLAPEADRPGARRPEKRKVALLASNLGAERRYWPRLESAFRAFLVELAEEDGAGEGSAQEGSTAPLSRWIDAVRSAALSALLETTESLDASGRTLKAVAVAESGFRRRLGAILTASNGSSEEVSDESTERA